ncbi:MAG: DUF421 domain-containing protein [Clostridia bacterium]|nr:DUF421 domain-containing protein [Clostridia bacterium]
MLNVILRTVILFFALLVMLRLMGKRQIGQLQPYEFAVMLISSNLVTVPMADLSTPLLWGILPIYVLLIMGIFLSELSMKSVILRRLICGKPRILIERGIILRPALKAVRYTLNDLMEQLRSNDVFDISEVYYAVLETNGEISVILKSDVRSLKPKDMGILPDQEEMNVALIMDGKLQKKNLKYVNKDEHWLKKNVRSDYGDILLALYDGSRLYVHYYNNTVKGINV